MANVCIEPVAKLAAGLTWFGFAAAGAATSAVWLNPATMVAVGGAGLIAAVTAGFQKYGVESSRTIEGIRKRTLEVVEARYGTPGELYALRDADAALSAHIDRCFLDRESLVAAAHDPKGFAMHAAELVMEELAKCCPGEFGAEGPEEGKAYARLVIGTALDVAVKTPEYFQQLQPMLELQTQQSLAELIERNGRIEEKIDAGFAAVMESIAELKRDRLGLSEKQVIHLLEEFKLGGVPVEQAEERLLKSAEELNGLRERLSRLSNEDVPEIAVKLQQAKDAIDAADFAKADRLLADAEEADLAAGERRIRRAAETIAERGALARSQAKFEDSADHYERAAATIAPYDAETEWKWRFVEVEVLLEYGDIFPRCESHYRAVSILRHKCLPHTPRDQSPTDWAAIQNSLGIALIGIGTRVGGEGGVQALKEAVGAFRSALEVYTRNECPEAWAGTQDNLGMALRDLGTRMGGVSGALALKDAVEAHRAALVVYTRGEFPVHWARVQNNLGCTLQSLGDRTGGKEGIQALGAAVAALRLVLEIYSQEKFPTLWARAQTNLGLALHLFGDHVDGKEGVCALSEAVQVFRAALDIFTRKDMPMHWATAQNNLGNVLGRLGECSEGDNGLKILRESVEAYRSALEVRTQEDLPVFWADTQNNLGVALGRLSERANREERFLLLNEAVAAFRAALQIRTHSDMPDQWALTTENLSLAETQLAILTADPNVVRRAILEMDEVIKAFEAMRADFYVDKATRSQEWMHSVLARLAPSRLSTQ